MKNRKNRGLPDNPNPTADPVMGQPQDCYDIINKYGTYNIQPTADTSNDFPAIAQGRPKCKKFEPRRD